jgi:hypothetical protein
VRARVISRTLPNAAAVHTKNPKPPLAGMTISTMA